MLKKLCLITAVTIIACDGDSVNPFPNPTVTLSPDSITILVGGSANFTSTVTNWTGSVQFVTRNEAIAQITSPGVVTGMAQGETYIVASIDAANARDSVRVRVTPSGGQT